jgi:hypothetical protein
VLPSSTTSGKWFPSVLLEAACSCCSRSCAPTSRSAPSPNRGNPIPSPRSPAAAGAACGQRRRRGAHRQAGQVGPGGGRPKRSCLPATPLPRTRPRLPRLRSQSRLPRRKGPPRSPLAKRLPLSLCTLCHPVNPFPRSPPLLQQPSRSPFFSPISSRPASSSVGHAKQLRRAAAPAGKGEHGGEEEGYYLPAGPSRWALLEVRVVRGVDLAIRDLRSSDPYVVLRIGKAHVRFSSPPFWFALLLVGFIGKRSGEFRSNRSPVYSTDDD